MCSGVAEGRYVLRSFLGKGTRGSEKRQLWEGGQLRFEILTSLVGGTDGEHGGLVTRRHPCTAHSINGR